MIDKRTGSVAEAVADIPDNAPVMIRGFGEAGPVCRPHCHGQEPGGFALVDLAPGVDFA